MTKKHLFVCAVVADCDKYYEVDAKIILAGNKDDASRIAHQQIRDVYPPDKGWYHTIKVIQIPSNAISAVAEDTDSTQ